MHDIINQNAPNVAEKLIFNIQKQNALKSKYDELITKCNKPTICRDTSIRDELYKRVVEAECDLEYTAAKEAILALDDFIAPIYKKYAYRPAKRLRYIDFSIDKQGKKNF